MVLLCLVCLFNNITLYYTEKENANNLVKGGVDKQDTSKTY